MRLGKFHASVIWPCVSTVEPAITLTCTTLVFPTTTEQRREAWPAHPHTPPSSSFIGLARLVSSHLLERSLSGLPARTHCASIDPAAAVELPPGRVCFLPHSSTLATKHDISTPSSFSRVTLASLNCNQYTAHLPAVVLAVLVPRRRHCQQHPGRQQLIPIYSHDSASSTQSQHE